MSTNYAPRIVTDNLILCLDAANQRSYSGSGDTWYDISNNGNNATLVYSPTFINTNGGVISFDDNNNQFATLNFNNTTFTELTFIAFLYRITQGSDGAGIIYNRNYGGNATGMALGYGNSNTLGYNWNDDPNTYYYDSGLRIDLNTWSYCALSVSPTNAIFCVNGNIVNRTYNHSSTTIGEGMQIAADSYTSRYYKSNFASAYLYSRALNTNEILQNYNALKGRFGL